MSISAGSLDEITTRIDQTNDLLGQILTALGGLVERVDALESDKADKNGLLSEITIDGVFDGVPGILLGNYLIEP